jgi:hypothetical protein
MGEMIAGGKIEPQKKMQAVSRKRPFSKSRSGRNGNPAQAVIGWLQKISSFCLAIAPFAG